MTVEARIEDCNEAGLPIGFKADASGVRVSRANSKGDDAPQWVWLCSPLTVLALTRDGTGKAWGRLVAVTDPDGNVHELAIPARLLAGDGADVRAVLLNLGWTMAQDPQARRDVMRLLSEWQPAARLKSATRLGWVDDANESFLLGDGRVIGGEKIVFQPEHASPAALEMHGCGSLEAWTYNVAVPSVGNKLLVLAISHALTGPLLGLLEKDGGGFHLRGASSRGKSTIQRVAVSVWGSPDFLHSWRATSNGLEGIAGVCNGTLLALDELGEVTGKEAAHAAYMLANGTGKLRADRKGNAREPLRWKTALLSSGEIALADKLAEANVRVAGGQEVRLLDLTADDGAHGAFDDLHGEEDGAVFADRLRGATHKSYGTAGPMFVEALLSSPDAARAAITKLMTTFRERATCIVGKNIDGQIERAIARFGLAAAAGEYAAQHGVTGWPDGTAMEAVLGCFKTWIATRGGSAPIEALRAIRNVRAFVTKYEYSRFQVFGANDEERLHRERAGWRDDQFFYISRDAWWEIHKGADPTRAARYLRDARLLQPGDGRNLSSKPPSEFGIKSRVYKISRDIMGAGDD